MSGRRRADGKLEHHVSVTIPAGEDSGDASEDPNDSEETEKETMTGSPDGREKTEYSAESHQEVLPFDIQSPLASVVTGKLEHLEVRRGTAWMPTQDR